MKTADAFRKIFYQPGEVFVALKVAPIWHVAAFVLVALVLAKSALVLDSSDRALNKLQTELFNEARNQAAIEHPELIDSESVVLIASDAVDVPDAVDQKMTFVSRGPSYPAIREITAFISFLLGLAFEVVYFKVVSVTMKLNLGVRNWITFSIWSHIPASALALFGAVLVSLSVSSQSHPFGPANHVNYEIFSLVRWIASPNTPEGGMSIFSIDIYHLDLALIWVLALQTIGFREWSGRSIVTSFSVVAIPIVVLYAVVMWMSADGLFWNVAFHLAS